MQKYSETIWDYELQGYVRRKKLRAFLGGFGVGAAFAGFFGGDGRLGGKAEPVGDLGSGG